MLRIKCPWCGERDQTEYQFGGEGHITRPENPAMAGDAEWADYLFYRRQWFNVARNTMTHEIIEVYKMGEQATTRAQKDEVKLT